ncbi:hypothetical protein L1049_007005 [Liquidambar formosana]|uniref:Subtilisin-like protease fibronectin type-III domain-containing protein n=1 Tax=Liquidambar formosana TaxID=63359 RepID=A0AAP0RGG9_LIQFO
MPPSVSVTIEPSVLSFSAIGEKKSFTVKVFGPKISQQPIMSGAIMWNDGIHAVKSPLVIYTILPGSLDSPYSKPQKNSVFERSFMYHKNGILGHD